MKKSLAFAVCAMMGFATAMPIAAETIGTGNGSSSTDVKGTYTPGTASDIVYSVDITWGDLNFAYTGASQGTWNPETHSYDGAADGYWTKDTAEIKVANSSNAAVEAAASYTAEEGFESANITCTPASLNLKTADNGLGEDGAGKATEGTIEVKVTGSLDQSAAQGTKIGTLTLTLK